MANEVQPEFTSKELDLLATLSHINGPLQRAQKLTYREIDELSDEIRRLEERRTQLSKALTGIERQILEEYERTR